MFGIARILAMSAAAALLAAAQTHTLTTIAGDGVAGSSEGRIDQPFGLAIGPDGDLYFCDTNNHRIMRLDLATRRLSLVAGTGEKGYAGDGGQAVRAKLNEPYEIAFDAQGDLFFCDRLTHTVRRIARGTGTISTVAGTGAEGFSGHGGPAEHAQLKQPHSIAFAPDGTLMICDILNYRIRALNLKSGLIDTWAGTGARGPAADGAPLAGTPLDGPRALAIGKSGDYYLALREGNAILRIDPKAGRIYHFAGNGQKGYSGDGGDARDAKLSGPKGVAVAPDGSLYIADTENHAIRRVDPSGRITTVAGTGERGDGPDGDPLKAKLARPHGVFVAGNGDVYISDTENNRVRLLR